MKSKWRNKLASAPGSTLLRTRWLYIVRRSLVVAITLLIASCNTEKAEQGNSHAHSTTYTCPMHPQIVQEGFGSCPICGMDLVQQHSGGDSTALGDDLHNLLQPVNKTIVAGIRTVTPLRKKMTVETEASGLIAYDTRRSYTIPIRFDGRIEKLYVNYNYEPVRKGQKILEIYSPGIVTAQKELLYLLESDPGNIELIAASKQKLRLLGLTDAQINRLAKTGEASYSLAVYSPYSGYISEGTAGVLRGSMTGAGKPAGSDGSASGSAINIREGMYLNKGQTAFRVINTDQVWAEFTIYPQAVPYMKEGDPLTIIPDFNKELTIEANVDLLQPFYQEGENFSKVRVYLDNAEGRFIPGQLVTARFQSQTDSAWWIPASAVLDLGTKKVVFRQEKEVFHPTPVRTGRESGKWIEIISGLSAADTVAGNGHYMVDSEGFINSSIQNDASKQRNEIKKVYE